MALISSSSSSTRLTPLFSTGFAFRDKTQRVISLLLLLYERKRSTAL
ncbi:hypothetical protein OIU76_027040 [Salix suchowensis]|nr:hypothetical protein OIU76_027040 [Salix suchowensis]